MGNKAKQKAIEKLFIVFGLFVVIYKGGKYFNWWHGPLQYIAFCGYSAFVVFVFVGVIISPIVKAIDCARPTKKELFLIALAKQIVFFALISWFIGPITFLMAIYLGWADEPVLRFILISRISIFVWMIVGFIVLHFSRVAEKILKAKSSKKLNPSDGSI